MRPRRKQIRRSGGRYKPVSQAWFTTVILLCAGFFWWLVQFFTTTSMDCAAYLDWVTGAAPANASILKALTLLAAAMALYLIADILRPKAIRRSAIIRIFQAGLVLAVISATIIFHGIVRPESRIAAIARQLELGFANAGIVARVYPELAYGIEPDWIQDNPEPVFDISAYAAYSPLAVKAGLLRCEVDAQVDALQMEPGSDYWDAARPFAITEPRR